MRNWLVEVEKGGSLIRAGKGIPGKGNKMAKGIQVVWGQSM